MKSIKFFELLEEDKDEMPSPDIAICSSCGGKFKPGEYDLEWEQDGWENPLYQQVVCRICDDGGCIDDWEFSKNQFKKYEEWEKRQKEKNNGL